jgi:hypothetical protein
MHVLYVLSTDHYHSLEHGIQSAKPWLAAPFFFSLPSGGASVLAPGIIRES